MSATKLSDLEVVVLNRFTEGADPINVCLREQLKTALVWKREFTGVGFFSKLTVDSSTPALNDKKPFRLTSVNGTAKGVRHGLSFVLLVTDGRLAELEGFTYDEPWPDPIEDFALT